MTAPRDPSGPSTPVAAPGMARATRPARGRLRIFFGYLEGVGTIDAMLRAARERASSGGVWLAARSSIGASRVPSDVGVLPAGADLDTILARRPVLLLLPRLADRNPDGARHVRRHQDARELLDAGIDVWSTLEVSQIESLADLIERISGVPSRDTVPDVVFDSADEVDSIDLPPDDLLARFDALPDAQMLRRPDRAVLVALREIALRRAADRLSRRQQPPAAGAAATEDSWSTAERLLVCVGPSPTSAGVIRAASRMASSLHAEWIAVHAESRHRDPNAELRIARHLRLAETLGAATAVLPPGDVAERVLECARARAVTRIVIGKTLRRPWYQRFERSLVARVIANSGGIDVHVIRTADDPLAAQRSPPSKTPARGYLGAAAVLAAATAIGAGFDALGLTEANLTLLYLLAVTAVAAWFGRGPAAAASVAAVLSFNFFFTAPRFTLRVHDPGYLFTFAVMLVIGLLVSHLTARITEQSRATSRRERKTEHLHQLSLSLSAASGPMQIVAAAAAHLESLLECEGFFLMPDENGVLRPAVTEEAAPELAHRQETAAVAAWVFRHGRAAGAGTDTHADCPLWCTPLHTPAGVIGVLALHAPDPETLQLPDRRRLVEAFSAHVALALQRDRLTEQVHRTIAQAENERLRSALLSSVSHDLRTPLSAITGASGSLLDAGERITASERRHLLQGIHDEADRLTQVVENLLHMTRLESGQLDLSREWNVVEDLVGGSLTRMQARLAGHDVDTHIAEGLPLVRVDGVLIDLVLCNLLDNAARYSPSGSVIEVTADLAGTELELAVADRGCGLTPRERERVFEKFYRGAAHRADGSRGAGLGLSICAAIAKLHGGRVRADDRSDGPGARFVLCLPLEDQPPAIEAGEVLPSLSSESVPLPTSVGEDDDER